MRKSIHTPEHQRLTELLRQLRHEAGLNQNELAELLDKPQSFVSKFETGERRLDLIELRHVCTAMGITLAQLVQRFEAEAPSLGRRKR